MGLFSRPKLPSDKPKWMREQEMEEQRRIQAALAGLRQSMTSKTPNNLMLQSNRYLQTSPYNTRFATSLLSSRTTLPGVSMDTGTYRTQ